MCVWVCGSVGVLLWLSAWCVGAWARVCGCAGVWVWVRLFFFGAALNFEIFKFLVFSF